MTSTADVALPPAPAVRRRRRWLESGSIPRRLLRHRSFVIGLVLFMIVVLAAVLAPLIAFGEPNKTAIRVRFREPSADFWFGTDNLGRNLWARVIYGSQLSLGIGFGVVLFNATLGVVLGAGDFRILLRHVMPNCMAPLIVQLSFVFAYSVLTEAILSFLGLGAPPTIPSWGNMISDGRTYIREAWWLCAIPGAAIAFTVLGLNLLGDGLRDVLDPRLKIQQG